MNIAAVADTHAVLWYIYASPELSQRAKSFIEHSAESGLSIGVSTISLAEMVYLIEKRRIAQDAYIRLKAQLDNPENVLTELYVTSQMSKLCRRFLMLMFLIFRIESLLRRQKA